MNKGERINVNNAKELGALGGKKSGEVRRRKKELKEALQVIMSLPYDGERGKLVNIENAKDFKALNRKNLTVGEQLAVNLIKKALSGDTTAFQIVRDTSGQKPKDEIEMTTIKVPSFGGEDELED